MNTEELLAEIQTAFPKIDMPSKHELRFHTDGCFECDYLARSLDERRADPVDGVVIRHVHQDMSCLSSKGWRWILPHYLQFCLTDKAAYNRMEIEFLIYNLCPGDQSRDATLKRMSLLNDRQVRCLTHFVEWLQAHPDWNEYCPDEIARAITFLRSI